MYQGNRVAIRELMSGGIVNNHTIQKTGGLKLLRMSGRISCARIILYSISNCLALSNCPFIGSPITALCGCPRATRPREYCKVCNADNMILIVMMPVLRLSIVKVSGNVEFGLALTYGRWGACQA